MPKKKPRNKKRNASGPPLSKELHIISKIMGTTDKKELERVNNKLQSAENSPRPHLDNIIALTEMLFPKLEKICATEHDTLAQHPTRPISPLCYCSYSGAGKMYIQERFFEESFQTLVVGTVAKQSHPSLYSGMLYDYTNTSLAVTVWKQGKTVYRFDDDLYAEIMDMERKSVLNTPIEVFNTIPEWSFYIETPQHSDYEGIIFTTYENCSDGDLRSVELSILALYNNGEDYTAFAMPTKDDKDTQVSTVGDVLNKILEGKNVIRGVNPFLNNGTFSNEATEKMVDIAIPLLVYLCTVNADIPVFKKSTNRKHSRKNTQTVSTNTVPVGERVGATIRAQKVRYISDNPGLKIIGEGGGQAKIPHMRSAHIHSYWTGSRVGGSKGDKLITKWIPPVLVNSKLIDEENHEMPTTIHRVKK